MLKHRVQQETTLNLEEFVTYLTIWNALSPFILVKSKRVNITHWLHCILEVFHVML